ncbi:MAG: hypothetical protein ABH885_00595, partial [Candidatus Omnitrophota bacterium]
MRKLFLVSLICIASTVIVISFFMPWAEISTSVTGLSKQVTDMAGKTVGRLTVTEKMISNMEKFTNAISNFGDVEISATVRGDNIP